MKSEKHGGHENRSNKLNPPKKQKFCTEKGHNYLKNAKVDIDIVENNYKKIIFKNNYLKKGGKVEQHGIGMEEIMCSEKLPYAPLKPNTFFAIQLFLLR